MMEGVEHLTYEEIMGELGPQWESWDHLNRSKNTQGEISVMYLNTWREGAKKRPGIFQCLMVEAGTMGTK